MEDLTGKQLGPYQVVDPLGEGGMASVYRAYQPSMERYVALKVLPRHFASDPEFVSRFSQEARVIANLQHPHILPVHDFGEADGYTYLVMRFVDGGTLSDWLKNRSPLSLLKIRSIMSQVGGALHYAHEQGVIHRDIKPGNILVDQWDNCLLTDFGLAKMVESTAHLTQTGGILGTPAYMSPEQGLGQEIDHRSDIYSLGVVLYQMAVGDLPYQAETPMAVVIKHIHDPLPPPRKRAPELPEQVELVILKALAKNPEERYETAGDMVRALQSATEAPTVANAVAPVTRIVPPIENREIEQPMPVGETQPVESVPSTERPDLAETAVPETAGIAKRSRSKLPWILGGIGVVAAVALIMVILNGVLDVEEGPAPAAGDRETDSSSAVVATIAVPEMEAEQATPSEVESPGAGAQFGESGQQDLDTAVLDELLHEVDVVYEEGDIPRALGILEEAISIFPEAADLHCQRGYTLNDLEAYVEAAASFEQCRMLAEQQGVPELQSQAHGEMAYAMAEAVLFEQGDLEQALRVLDEALQDPIAPGWLYCDRAEMKLQLDDRPGAVSDFNTCQSYDDIGEYWQIRSRTAVMEMEGSAALAEGNLELAVEQFTAWSELEPDAPWPHCFLGEAFVELGELAPAVAAYERCRDVSDDPEAHRWAMTSLMAIEGHQARDGEDWDRALQAFSEAINFSPDDAWLYCERAEVFNEIGAIDEARRDSQMCLELSGDDVDVRTWAEDLLQEMESITP